MTQHPAIGVRTGYCGTCSSQIFQYSLLGKKSLRRKGKVQTQKPKQEKKEKERMPISAVGNAYSQAFQCELCEKIFSTRKNAVEHIQDDHQ